MRSTRWLIGGALALGCAAPFASACGDSTFAAANDASVSEAAASDATPSISDAGFCSTMIDAALCADFDESDLRAAFVNGQSVIFFSSVAAVGGGVIGAVDSGRSPPYALEVALPVDAGPLTDGSPVESAVASGTLAALTGATHFRIEADLRFNQIGDLSAGNLTLGGIQLAGPSEYTVYALQLRAGHMYVDAFSTFGGFTSIDLGSVPSGSSWFHLIIDVTLGTANGKLSASIDGRAATSTTSLANTIDTHPSLSIGPATQGGTGIIDMSFDNVLIFADNSFDAGAVISPMQDE